MHLIPTLHECQIIKNGHFTLKSGIETTLYCDFKGGIQYPLLMADLSAALAKILRPHFAVSGVPMGGQIYATTVSQLTKRPLMLIRDQQKTYGTKQQIEGYQHQVILIEDVITSGYSVLQTIELLKNLNIKVVQIVALLDRQVGGVEKIINLGYRVDCVYTLTDLQAGYNVTELGQKLLEIKRKKNTRLIASLDVDDVEEIYQYIEIMGPHVCAIKLHSFLYPTLDTDKILDLKQKHEFMIIDDQKLADIPYISLKLVNKVIHFADLVTVHGLVGQELLDAISSKIGILMVYDMTVSGNLFDENYKSKVGNLKLKSVVGMISPKRVKGYLTFTTGISNIEISDSMGQRYQTVRGVDADFLIVGRSLYESRNIGETIKEYK